MNLNRTKVRISFGVAIIFLLHIVSGEIFTALADMEELLETEAVLIGNLEAYIEAQEQKLDYLRKYDYRTD